MGTYMQYILERKTKDGKYIRVELDDPRNVIPQSYSVYGWLANVRNYSAVTPIIPERRGIPKDTCPHVIEEHYNNQYAECASYLMVEELLYFDYTQYCEDRRCTINGNGHCTCAPGGRISNDVL